MGDDLVLEALEAAVTAASAARDAYLARQLGDDDLVPLKTAADLWRITDGAALMRVRRDPMLGVKRLGRWFIRRAALPC